MKLVAAFQWAIAHQDAIFMFLGEFFAACMVLVAALRMLIKLCAKLADLTDTNTDNKAVQSMSNGLDAFAAWLDWARRKVPAPRFGPSQNVQPLTTRETRAVAAASMPPAMAVMAPLESKRPPPVTVLPAPEIIGAPVVGVPVDMTQPPTEEKTP